MSYIRISGVLMMIVFGALAGNELRLRLYERAKKLRTFERMCGDILALIRTGNMPIYRIASVLSERYAFLKECAAAMDGAGDFAGAAAQTAKKQKELRREERECLMLLARSLGRGDEESESRLLLGTAERFSQFASAAEEEKREKGKVYLSCGTLLGVLAALIVL